MRDYLVQALQAIEEACRKARSYLQRDKSEEAKGAIEDMLDIVSKIAPLVTDAPVSNQEDMLDVALGIQDEEKIGILRKISEISSKYHLTFDSNCVIIMTEYEKDMFSKMSDEKWDIFGYYCSFIGESLAIRLLVAGNDLLFKY